MPLLKGWQKILVNKMTSLMEACKPVIKSEGLYIRGSRDIDYFGAINEHKNGRRKHQMYLPFLGTGNRRNNY
jgi:hypothetical protein